MEPYIAMMDLRIFMSPAFLELSLDAQSRFAELVGTSDRMGVANLYYVWTDSRIKSDLMETLYRSELVWPVDAFYCFIPSIYNANRKIRSGKYKSSFDNKGFQACIDKYPCLVQNMTDSERDYFKKHGILMNEDTEVLPAATIYESLPAPSVTAIEYEKESVGEVSKDSDDYTYFEGINMDRRDYAKYQTLTVLHRDFEDQYNVSILTERDVIDWFMNLYRNDYKLNGVKVNDLNALFKNYCKKVMENKRIQGTLAVKGGYL